MIPFTGMDAIVKTIPLSGNAGINHQSIPAILNLNFPLDAKPQGVILRGRGKE
jgi:hypothetical protein